MLFVGISIDQLNASTGLRRKEWNVISGAKKYVYKRFVYCCTKNMIRVT